MTGDGAMMDLLIPVAMVTDGDFDQSSQERTKCIHSIYKHTLHFSTISNGCLGFETRMNGSQAITCAIF